MRLPWNAHRLLRVLADPRRLVAGSRHALEMRRYDRRIRRYFLSSSDKDDAIFLGSYPKSGNTHLRLIFANVIALAELDGKIVDYGVLDEILPTDQFQADLKRSWSYRTLPCIIKTHNYHRPIFGPFRTIFLYRNPYDTMVSAFEYFRRRRAPQAYGDDAERVMLPPYRGTIGDFVREQFDDWCLHYLSWRDPATAVVTYENLRTDPMAAMVPLCERLGLRLETEILGEAIQRSSFERVRRLEEEHGKSSKMAKLDGAFARSGKVGQWEDRFDRGDLAYLEARLAHFGINQEDFTFLPPDAARPRV